MLSISATPREICQSPQRSKGEYTPIPTSLEEHDSGERHWCCHRWLDGDFSIIPDERPMIERWDIVLISALFVTAVLLPLDVSLLQTECKPVNKVIAVTDMIFVLDMVLQFNLAYNVTWATRKGEHYEIRPLWIARRYMAFPCSQNMEAGWFWPDVLTVTPWDTILPDLGVHSHSVRLIRLLRLLRVLRLVRVLKLFKKWQTSVGLSMALLKIATCAIVTIFLVHWLACLWAHMGSHPMFYGHSKQDSWLANYIGEDVDKLSHFEKYYASLYFCTVVLTTVGFGDVVPINQVEVVTMTATVFLTGVTWAWVVGNIVNVITNLDTFGNLFNTAMDDLNTLMGESGVNKSTRVRIRKHLHESYWVQKKRHAHAALAWLSEGLQGELAIQSGVDKICERIWYFKGLPQLVLIELADEFKATMFSPNETVMSRDSMSVITRGSCLKNGRLLVRESVYGEDMILMSEHLRDTSCPVTLSFMEVMTIHREDMMVACDKFPEFNHRLRRAQIRLAVWRGFIFVANQLRAENAHRIGNRRRSCWDRHFFSIGKMGKAGLNSHAHTPGWKEHWISQDKDNAADFEGVQQNLATLLQAVETLKHGMVQSSLDTQSRLRAFEGRFECLEKEVAAMGSKVEALGQGLHELQAPFSSAGTCGSIPNETSGGRWPSLRGGRPRSPKG